MGAEEKRLFSSKTRSQRQRAMQESTDSRAAGLKRALLGHSMYNRKLHNRLSAVDHCSGRASKIDRREHVAKFLG